MSGFDLEVVVTETKDNIISMDLESFSRDDIQVLHSTEIGNSPNATAGLIVKNDDVVLKRRWSISAINTGLSHSSSEDMFSSPEISRYVDSQEIADVVEAERRIQAEAAASALRQMKVLGIQSSISFNLDAMEKPENYMDYSFFNQDLSPELPNFLLTSPAKAYSVHSIPKMAFSSPKPDINGLKCKFGSLSGPLSPLSSIGTRASESTVEAKCRPLSNAENYLMPPSSACITLLPTPTPASVSSKENVKTMPCEIEHLIINLKRS